MSVFVTPQGPGFFIFFQTEYEYGRGKKEDGVIEEKDELEIIYMLMCYLTERQLDEPG